MRQKARKLNDRFGDDRWTPRMIDMILWASHGDSCGHGAPAVTDKRIEEIIAVLEAKLDARTETQRTP